MGTLKKVGIGIGGLVIVIIALIVLAAIFGDTGDEEGLISEVPEATQLVEVVATVVPPTATQIPPTIEPEVTETSLLPAITADECWYIGYVQLEMESAARSAIWLIDSTDTESMDVDILNSKYEFAGEPEAAPPDTMQFIGDVFLSALQKFSEGGVLHEEGVDSLDPAKTEEAHARFAKGFDRVVLTTTRVEEFMVSREGSEGCWVG